MLVSVDAAQLEWRVAAWLSGDSVAIKEINEGVDTHKENQQLLGLPTRLISKKYLFRTIYRGSGWSFAHDPDFSHVSRDPDFWDDLNRKFYNKYKGLDKWHHKLARLCAERKAIVSPIGRAWHVLPNEDGSLPWTVFTNYPVQGTGADLMMVARISLFRRMKKSSLRSLLVSTIHDSILIDSPSEEIDDVARLALKVFDDIPANFRKLWGIELPVKFPGSIKIGPNLSEMKEYANQSPGN